MSKFYRGGAAFPLEMADGNVNEGMKLRDFFAAHAIAGLYASCHPAYNAADCDDNIRYAVFRAYRTADIMLHAREQDTQWAECLSDDLSAAAMSAANGRAA